MSSLLSNLNPVNYLNNIEFGVVFANLSAQIIARENLPMNLLYVASLVVVVFGTNRYLNKSGPAKSVKIVESAEPAEPVEPVKAEEPSSSDVFSRASKWVGSFFVKSPELKTAVLSKVERQPVGQSMKNVEVNPDVKPATVSESTASSETSASVL